MKKLILFIITFTLLWLTGCSENSTDSGKRTIAVSIAPEATFVKAVCGENFDIITSIPAGASPETYEPTPAEMQKITNAEIYFAIGVPAEENSILPLIDRKKTVVLQDFVAKEYPELSEGEHRDPHIWLSPKRVIVMVEKIAETLKHYDPKNADFYNENAKNYILELGKLNEYIVTAFKDIKNRNFLVFHPAFSYFADDYSLSMHALEEHGKETTAKRLAEMTDLAKEKNIKTIFYQAEASNKTAVSFAEEIGGTAVMLEPLSPDYIENIKKMTDLLQKAMK